jgi:hypothetical protein
VTQHAPLHSPGLPPGYVTPTANDAPPVVLYFRLYAGFVALMGMGVAAMGLISAVMPLLTEKSPKTGDLVGTAVLGGFFMLIGLVMAALHVVATVMPRRPWAHTYGLVTLALAFVFFTGCCIAAVPLLIFWSRPEVKDWFAKGEAEESAAEPPTAA